MVDRKQLFDNIHAMLFLKHIIATSELYKFRGNHNDDQGDDMQDGLGDEKDEEVLVDTGHIFHTVRYLLAEKRRSHMRSE